MTLPPALALPKRKKSFQITSRKNKKKKSRKGKDILLSESEPEIVSSDADSVSLELTDASEDKSSQESDFLSSDSDLEKVFIYFNIN